MHMHDKYGRAVALGVRRIGPLTARSRPGKPLPLELVVHPQRAVRRRLKGNTHSPEGYGNVANPSAPIMGMMVANMDSALSFLKTTGRYGVEVEGACIGRTDMVAYACALAAMIGDKARVTD
jgi:hypothetical protein